MKFTTLMTSALVLTVAANAYADDKKNNKVEPVADRKAMHDELQPSSVAPLVKPMPPKPVAAPEIAALAKTASGNWKCKGLMMLPNGSSVPMLSTMKIKLELDGFWLHGTMVQAGKGGFKFEAMTTYDTNTKTWHRLQGDNMGSQEVATSEGFKDGKIVWNATSRNAWGTALARHYEENVGKTVKMWGEYSADKGKTWVKAYESTCTK
jgi:hypothetical protein